MDMAREPIGIDEEYFLWLYSLVDDKWADDPRESRVHLLRMMYNHPYIPTIGNDENRAIDGCDLRFEYQDSYILTDEAWLNLDCSFLEMTIALANRMAFETDQMVKDCFWEILGNLDVAYITDDQFPDAEQDVIDAMERINQRDIQPSGLGGFFPLYTHRDDQRRIELLYQMSAYIIENDPLYR